MTTTARTWLVLGWAGFALLPWHLPSDANWYDWVIGYSAQGPRAALGLAWSGGAWWLAPITLALVIAAWPLVRYGREQASGMLAGAGIGGLALVVIQGFAIGLRGWNWSVLADLLGTEGPSQAGMGPGAGLVSTAFLMVVCHVFAGRGWCRSDAFIVGVIGVVVALTVIFVLFPVVIILTSAFRDDEGAFALAQFADKFFDRSVWGLDCLGSTLRCGVAWNTLVLAIAVGFGATALGLAFALVATHWTALRRHVARSGRAADHHAALCDRPGAHPAVRTLRQRHRAARRLVRHCAVALDLRMAGHPDCPAPGVRANRVSGSGRGRSGHQPLPRRGRADAPCRALA